MSAKSGEPTSAPVPQPAQQPSSPPAGSPASPAAPSPAPTPAATASAKTAPAKPAARPPTPRSGAGAAFLLAVLAMLVAVGSTAVAVYALDVAREAKSKAADTVAAAPRPAATTPAPAATPAAPTASSAPRSQFTPDLVRMELRIPAAQRCNAVYVDVDTLQVGNLTGHEFYLSSCLGPTTVRIDETSGAVPTGDSPTPEVCAAQLAGTSTSTTELVLQVRTGLTFCLLTSKDEAIREHIPQRIAIVEIRDFAVDGSVVAAVSTYRVPNAG
jgi:hypothetical protein